MDLPFAQRSWIALWVMALFLVGCSDPNEPKIYSTQGVVKELKPDEKTAIIHHQDIPGYMQSMTMALEVRNTNELTAVKVGDTVTFRMLVTAKDGWIDQVRVISNAPPAAAEPDPATAVNVVPNVVELKVGDVVPDYAFTNELGKLVRLNDYRGKVLALTFIFTRCPFPTFCPRITDHFKSVQAALEKDPAAPRDWRLLSVSFDPAFDTPATLKAYGKARAYNPERWSLVSGDMLQIASLAQHFGLYFSRNAVPSSQNHNLRTVVIDPMGRVQSIHIGNEWTPEELMTDMKTAGAAKP